MILMNYSKYLLQFCEKQINMIYRIYLFYEGLHIFKKHLPKKKGTKHFSSDHISSSLK